MNTTLAVIAVIVVIAVVGASWWFWSQKGGSDASPNRTQTEGGLMIEDLNIGIGAEAKAGNTVSVQYVGTLLDGVKFDSSYDHGKPFSFVLGLGQVIPGWDQGVQGMKVGGKRKLTIPPSLAYGATGVPGAIPPNATLVFAVELLDVQ